MRPTRSQPKSRRSRPLVWQRKQGRFAFPTQMTDPAYATLAKLSYNDLLALMDTNMDYRKLILKDQFWDFKIRYDTQGLYIDMIKHYIGMAIMNHEYYIVKRFIHVYPDVSIPKKYIKTLVALCDDTPASKPYFDILLLLEPQYKTLIISFIQSRKSSFILYCENPQRYHPRIYLHFVLNYSFNMPVTNYYGANKMQKYAEWTLRFYKLYFSGLETDYEDERADVAVISTLLLDMVLKSNDLTLLEEFLKIIPVPVVPRFIHYKLLRPEVIKVLIKYDTISLSRFVRWLLNTRKTPKSKIILSILKQQPEYAEQIAEFKEESRKRKAKGSVLDEEDPLYKEIRDAVMEQNLVKLTEMAEEVDGNIVITYTTVDGVQGTFFLNKNSLNKIQDFLLLPKSTTLTPELTSDYVYNFIVNPIKTVSVMIIF